MDFTPSHSLRLKEAFADQKAFQTVSIIDNYDKAKPQLTKTIKDVSYRCRKVGVELQDALTVEAFAVFNRTVPRHNAYQKKLAAQFLLETNGIPLYFKNCTEV